MLVEKYRHHPFTSLISAGFILVTRIIMVKMNLLLTNNLAIDFCFCFSFYTYIHLTKYPCMYLYVHMLMSLLEKSTYTHT